MSKSSIYDWGINVKIDFPGEGVGEINERIEKLEKMVDALALVNDYLLALLELSAEKKLNREIWEQMKDIEKRCGEILTEKKKDGDQTFDEAIRAPTTLEPPLSLEEALGIPNFEKASQSPIVPPPKDNPEEIIERLEGIISDFVYENNQLEYLLTFVQLPGGLFELSDCDFTLLGALMER